MNGNAHGRVWGSRDLLRVGRLDSLEVVLDDSSVSRCHAEIMPTERGWRLRDLGSTNGTRLNGVPLGSGQWPLRVRDLIQFGEISLHVEAIEEEKDSGTLCPDSLCVEASAKTTWDEALRGVVYDSSETPRAGEQLLALLRAGHHLVNLEREEDLLQSILNDAVSVLDAQRAAIVLPTSVEGKMQLRALATGRGQPKAHISGFGDSTIRASFSQSLAKRCFSRGESILCQSVEEDAELSIANSIAEGSMASVLCVLLRTPRKRLGVLHLDRSPWQKPFTAEDLHLADALAANVSAGLESAQLLKKQRDLFLNTITILAQAVELRDPYTGDHTSRVTTYSVLLAKELNVSDHDLELIQIGTPLHDIGKIGIRDEILLKPEKLTPAEFEIMKQHTVMGANILALVPDLQDIIPIVRSHHERWDGKGYPDGQAGEDISSLARIVAVADAFDAMTSDRPYRRALSVEEAFAEVHKNSGIQFDPNCATAFLRIRHRLEREMYPQTEDEDTIRSKVMQATAG
jgi:putative nucleotidyltransferase with HDIG domain